MLTPLLLAVLALVLAGPVPWSLARAPRLRITPRAAMLAWQATALAAVLAALGAGLALASAPLRGDGGPGVVVAVVALLMTGTVGSRLLLSGHRVGTRLRALRRRHRDLVDLIAAEAVAGARVLELDQPTAYCLPGVVGARVVVTRAAVDRLSVAELDAVLAHERAHLRARHDLVVEAFTVLQHAFPAVITSAAALGEVRLLAEVLADRAARRRHGAAPLVRALAALEAVAPPGAVAAAGAGQIQARLAVLRDDARHPVQSALLLGYAAAVLAVPTVLVVLPWIADVLR